MGVEDAYWRLANGGLRRHSYLVHAVGSFSIFHVSILSTCVGERLTISSSEMPIEIQRGRRNVVV